MGVGQGQGPVGRVGQDRIGRGGVCAGGSVAYLDILLKISGTASRIQASHFYLSGPPFPYL